MILSKQFLVSQKVEHFFFQINYQICLITFAELGVIGHCVKKKSHGLDMLKQTPAGKRPHKSGCLKKRTYPK